MSGPRSRSQPADSSRAAPSKVHDPRRILLLLGRRDSPTDGIEDYSHHLATALAERGHSVDILICDWVDQGWRRGLSALRRELIARPARLVLMQFTHLMWSRRGFPYMAIPIALVIKRSGATLGIVMHDPVPYRGSRIRDRVRRSIQSLVLRRLTDLAYAVVIPIAPSNIRWSRPSVQSKIHSIPIGSNVGHSLAQFKPAEPHTFTIAVFGVTEPVAREAEELCAIVPQVAAEVGPVHLVLLGRGSREAQPYLEKLLSHSDVTISFVGIAPAGEIASRLAEADVALFIRGEVSARRGTAIAAIAHGVPLIAYEGVETGWPLTEAGVVLVGEGDTQAVAQALARVANDSDLAASLRARSRAAFGEHFAWGRIAKRFDYIFSADGTLPEAGTRDQADQRSHSGSRPCI